MFFFIRIWIRGKKQQHRNWFSIKIKSIRNVEKYRERKSRAFVFMLIFFSFGFAQCTKSLLIVRSFVWTIWMCVTSIKFYHEICISDHFPRNYYFIFYQPSFKISLFQCYFSIIKHQKPDGNLWRDTMFFFPLYLCIDGTHVRMLKIAVTVCRSNLNRVVNSYRSFDRCVVNDCSYYKLEKKRTNNLTVACVTVQWNLYFFVFASFPHACVNATNGFALFSLVFFSSLCCKLCL